MNPKHILASLFAAAVLPSQAASDLSNPLNTYVGNSQENNNGAAQPVFLAGNPLADPVIPPSGLEVSALATGFTPSGAWQTIYFNDTSAVDPVFPGAKFGQNQVNNNNGRNYMRTVAADYFTQDFTAYVTVRRPALDASNRRSVFFGMGTGRLNANGANPDFGTNNASAYIELQNGYGNASRKVQSNGPTTTELAYPAMTTVSDNSMRLRMQWNSVTRTIAYSIDYAYVPGDAFAADQTFPSNVINTQFNEWAGGDRSSIYFGGDRSVVFTDLVIDVTQPATPPTPGTLTLVSVGDAVVNLQWSSFAIPGTTYSVYRSTTTGNFPDPAITTGLTTTSYTDTAAVNGTTYFYRVTQSNTVAVMPESAPSNQISATPVAGAVTPEGVVARNAGHNVLLIDWNDLVSPFDTYKVYRATVAEGPFTEIAPGLTASHYTDQTVVSGTTYFYQITSVLGAQESSPSATSSAAIPALLEVFVDFNSHAVNTGRGALGAGPGSTWNGVGGATSVATSKLNDSYGVVSALGIAGTSNLIYAAGAGANVGGSPATLGANYNLMADYRFSDGGNIRNYTFSGLAPSRTYDLYLFGYGGGADQNAGFDVGGVVKQTTNPVGLTTIAEGRQYVTFTFVSGADGTFLFRWSAPGNLGLTDAQPGNGAGFNGFQLVENAAAVLQARHLAAVVDTNSINLTWDAVSGADSYEVHRSATPAADYVLLASPLGASFDDTSAVPGTTYYYVVKAVVGSSKSFSSAEARGMIVPLILDADTDGLSDADEALIGTDPNDPRDFYVAKTSTVTPNGGNYDVSFVINGAEGDYVIERSSTLDEGSWVEIGTSKITWTWTTGVLDNLTLSTTGLTPAPGGKEFFRAKGVATVTP